VPSTWTPFFRWVAAEKKKTENRIADNILSETRIYPTEFADVIILITRLYHNTNMRCHKHRTKHIKHVPTTIHQHTWLASKCLRRAKYSAPNSANSFSWNFLQFSLLSTVYTTEPIRTVHVDGHRRLATVLIPPSTKHGGKEKHLSTLHPGWILYV